MAVQATDVHMLDVLIRCSRTEATPGRPCFAMGSDLRMPQPPQPRGIWRISFTKMQHREGLLRVAELRGYAERAHVREKHTLCPTRKSPAFNGRRSRACGFTVAAGPPSTHPRTRIWVHRNTHVQLWSFWGLYGSQPRNAASPAKGPVKTMYTIWDGKQPEKRWCCAQSTPSAQLSPCRRHNK